MAKEATNVILMKRLIVENSTSIRSNVVERFLSLDVEDAASTKTTAFYDLTILFYSVLF